MIQISDIVSQNNINFLESAVCFFINKIETTIKIG